MNSFERTVRARATQVYQRVLPDELRSALRHRLVLNSVTRRLYDDYAELDAIEAALRRIEQGPDAVLNLRSTAGMTERVVEIPWVLSRYRGEARVLDIGPAYALPLYIQGLRRLRIPELHGVDLSTRQIPGMAVTRADVRKMPFANGWFDLIFCVSTLEHIGRDNAHYQVVASADVEEGDVAALTEMRRVLAPAGRILITVPFGRLDVQDWQKQYDQPAWAALIRRAGLRAVETEWYGNDGTGWHRAKGPESLADHAYQGHGAPAATAVQCAVLTHEDLEE
jgi:SAM-dependent methyltransferase